VRVAGYATLVGGGAGGAAGFITYAIAWSQASSLDSSCPNRACNVTTHPGIDSTISSYEATRAATIALFVAGAVVSATGLTMVLAAPKRVTVAIGPFGVSGTF
jgi:hypothetical protein